MVAGYISSGASILVASDPLYIRLRAEWISLMLWLAADPRSEGPTPENPDEPEYYTTALR